MYLECGHDFHRKPLSVCFLEIIKYFLFLIFHFRIEKFRSPNKLTISAGTHICHNNNIDKCRPS